MAIDFNHRFHRIDTDASADLSIIPKLVLTNTISIGNGSYTLPAIDGTLDYVLKTDGAGTVTWQAEAGGGGGDLHYIGEGTPTTNPVATGTDSLAMGDGAYSYESTSIAIGYQAYTGQTSAGTTEINAVAIGRDSRAHETGGTAIGTYSKAGATITSVGPYATAIGYGSAAYQDSSIAIGNASRVGSSGGTSAIKAIAIGKSSFVRSSSSIAIGDNSYVNSSSPSGIHIGSGSGTTYGVISSSYAIVIGYNSKAVNSSNSTIVGGSQTVGAGNVIAIGYGNTSVYQNAIVIGSSMSPTSSNQCVIGINVAGGISDFFLGKGVTHVTPVSTTINPTGGSGTDVAGANITIAGGKGTGTGAGGDIIFSTAKPGTTSATQNTLAEAMRIDDVKNVSIGTAAITTTATDGFLYIPTCAGTPTGVPTTKIGLAPMVYDSTNNKFWMYDGSWIGIALA